MQRAFAIALALISTRAAAHGSSVTGAHVAGRPLEVGEVVTSLEAQAHARAGTSAEDPAFVERTEDVLVLAAFSFSPRERIDVTFTASLLWRTWSAQTEGYSPYVVRNAALGDADLSVRYGVPLCSWQVFFAIGSSLPTGPNELQADGYRVDEHAQLGSGALGPYAAIAARRELESAWLAASVTGAWPLENRNGYALGPSLALSGSWGTSLGKGLEPQLELKVRHAAPDRHGRVAEAHSGGLLVSATPVLAFRLVGPVVLYGGVELPIASSLLGEQSVGPRFRLGVAGAIE